MGLGTSWRKRARGLRNGLSFSDEVRRLVELLNQDIVHTDRLRLRVATHPGGFIRSLSARRLSMGEAYLKLAHSQTPADYPVRLSALRLLVHHAHHAKTLSLPLNTARVQIALMKECVRARASRTRQLELMQDFAVASYGREVVIRRLLRELGLIEVPDDGRTLKELNLAWDGHVHDSSSLGRKTPSHLLLDAFIKGVSRLTVAYYDLEDPGVRRELFEAAEILGIQVEVGVEFSVGEAFKRRHFMFVPPQDGTAEGLDAFLEAHFEELGPFREGLIKNAEARYAGMKELLAHFNEVVLPLLNARYKGNSLLLVRPVSWLDVAEMVPEGRISKAQIGYVLASKLRPVFHRRVLYLRNQRVHVLRRQREKSVSQWELDNIEAQYRQALQDYRECTPFLLQERYVGKGAAVDRASAFTSLEQLSGLFRKWGGRLVFIHPLSVGLNAAVEEILAGCGVITDVETFNMSDALLRDPAELRRLNSVVEWLNFGDEERLKASLLEWGFGTVDGARLHSVCKELKHRLLRPSFGSDYIGGHPRNPGMGFTSTVALTHRAVKDLRRHGHSTVPQALAEVKISYQNRDNSEVPGDAQVFFVSRIQAKEYNVLGDEREENEKLSAARLWRYLNPGIRLTLKILVAIVPATLMVGPWYAALWLGITAFRNITADVVSSSGMMMRTWSLSNIDRDNLGNSVFWTGFSVPILGLAKHGFDLGWPLLGVSSEVWATIVKFWVIASANGLYISTHNRIRGFPASVIRANFFRTVLSWPLATVGSYALSPLGVPAIVQSKVWSDVVAGVIEGTGKFVHRLKLRQRDLVEILTAMKKAERDPETTALIQVDLLYVWAQRDRGRAALRFLLTAGKAVPGPTLIPRGDSSDGAMELRELALLRDRLQQDLTSAGSIERLTCAVLEHFSDSEAELLVRFIGDYHDDFVDWLEALPTLTEPPDPV